jgi:hypothetical protein
MQFALLPKNRSNWDKVKRGYFGFWPQAAFGIHAGMNFTPPTEQQARILWTSLTWLAVAILAGLIGLLLWGLALVVNRLSSVLLPLAIAGIIAYVLDPVVDFLERRGVSRGRAILSVFSLLSLIVLLSLVTIVPRLIYETGELVERVPEYTKQLQEGFDKWVKKYPPAIKAQVAHPGQVVGPTGIRSPPPPHRGVRTAGLQAVQGGDS